MTQNECDDTCPCRTPVCEDTCPNYQFKYRFSIWLVVNYPNMNCSEHDEIVEGARIIFDDLVM